MTAEGEKTIREGWADNDSPLCVSDDGAEWHCGADPSEGDAGILTTPEEIDTWLTAPATDALQLQRPLPDNLLRIVDAPPEGTPEASDDLFSKRVE